MTVQCRPKPAGNIGKKKPVAAQVEKNKSSLSNRFKILQEVGGGGGVTLEEESDKGKRLDSTQRKSVRRTESTDTWTPGKRKFDFTSPLLKTSFSMQDLEELHETPVVLEGSVSVALVLTTKIKNKTVRKNLIGQNLTRAFSKEWLFRANADTFLFGQNVGTSKITCLEGATSQNVVLPVTLEESGCLISSS